MEIELTVQQRVWTVLWYHESKAATFVSWKFAERWPNESPPGEEGMNQIYEQFITTGSVLFVEEGCHKELGANVSSPLKSFEEITEPLFYDEIPPGTIDTSMDIGTFNDLDILSIKKEEQLAISCADIYVPNNINKAVEVSPQPSVRRSSRSTRGLKPAKLRDMQINDRAEKSTHIKEEHIKPEKFKETKAVLPEQQSEKIISKITIRKENVIVEQNRDSDVLELGTKVTNISVESKEKATKKIGKFPTKKPETKKLSENPETGQKSVTTISQDCTEKSTTKLCTDLDVMLNTCTSKDLQNNEDASQFNDVTNVRISTDITDIVNDNLIDDSKIEVSVTDAEKSAIIMDAEIMPNKLEDCNTEEETTTRKTDPKTKSRRKSDSKSKLYKCPDCGVISRSQAAFGEHAAKEHKNLYPYTCNLCPNVYKRLRQLTSHIKSHGVKTMKSLTCNICEKKCNTKQALSNHMRVHERKPNVCEHCGLCFMNRATFLGHLNTHVTEKNFACEQCSKTFKSKSILSQHVQYAHSDVRPFVCGLCGDAFKRKHALQHHEKAVHLNEKAFNCDKCGEAFKHRVKLTLHIRKVHLKQQPFCCEFCPKKFYESGALKVHRRVHTKERPYVCTICGDSFPQKGRLDRHIRIHTGIKAYACQKCSKTFSEKDYLRKHMASHGEDRPYQCQICNVKCFKTLQHLKAHIKTHDAIALKYTCPQDDCNAKFVQKRSWKQHIVKHHPEIAEGVTVYDHITEGDENDIYNIIIPVDGITGELQTLEGPLQVEVYEIKSEEDLEDIQDITIEVPVDGGFGYTQ